MSSFIDDYGKTGMLMGSVGKWEMDKFDELMEDCKEKVSFESGTKAFLLGAFEGALGFMATFGTIAFATVVYQGFVKGRTLTFIK